MQRRAPIAAAISSTLATFAVLTLCAVVAIHCHQLNHDALSRKRKRAGGIAAAQLAAIGAAVLFVVAWAPPAAAAALPRAWWVRPQAHELWEDVLLNTDDLTFRNRMRMTK